MQIFCFVKIFVVYKKEQIYIYLVVLCCKLFDYRIGRGTSPRDSHLRPRWR